MGSFLRFQLERWLQQGLWHQLAFTASLILLVSVVGGLAAWILTAQFANPLEAIWWSFLRLTDPGYLGDDDGVILRVISTIVTVLGYVLFMGSLIAILTQSLNNTLQRFEQGLSSISMRGHIVVLGWTNRTPEIVRQLFAARGRLKRFLNAHGVRRLRVVVVADEVDTERRLRLRSYVAAVQGRSQVFLRRGSGTMRSDLGRFDLTRASVIVVPGDEFRYGGAEASDARVVKTLLNLRSFFAGASPGVRPQVVAEVNDPDKEAAAAHAYDGPIEVIPGDAVIARLLARALLDRRLATVLLELLANNEGCSPFLREAPGFTGRHPLDIGTGRDRAQPIGILDRVDGRAVARLNPPAEVLLGERSRVVFIAHAFEDCVPSGAGRAPGGVAAAGFGNVQAQGQGWGQGAARRILLLGWSGHLAQVVEDLLAVGVIALHLTIVSRAPRERRSHWFAGRALPDDVVHLEHVEADILASGALEMLSLTAYDSILIAATSYRENAEESDARVLTAYELLKAERQRQCGAAPTAPDIVLELSHASSKDYEAAAGDTVLTRPQLMGFLQSHVALRPELNSIFDELFLPSRGAGIALRDGPAVDGGRYADLVASSLAPGDIPLGVLLDAGGDAEAVELLPAEDFRWPGRADLVVLTAES